MNVKFYIGKISKDGRATLEGCIHYKCARAKFGTAVSIHPEQWQHDRQKATGSGATQINQQLDRLRAKAVQAFQRFCAEGNEPTARQIADALKNGGSEQKGKVMFADVWQAFYADCERRGLAENSLANFQKLKRKFDRYKITFATLPKLPERMKADGSQPSSIQLATRLSLQFCRFAVKQGHLKKLPEFETIKVKSGVPVVLTLEELRQFFQAALSESLARVRDLFIFQTCTGQRVSDILSFQSDQVKGGIWHIRQQKTGKTLAIPLSLPIFGSMAQKVLDRNNGTLPKMTPQNYNLLLKKAAKAAGLTGSFQDENGRIYEKWQVLHTHSGRASFITITSAAGVPLAAIRQISGHADLKILSRYLGTLAESELLKAFDV